MTELVVALDGPEDQDQYALACSLIDAGVSWLKIGPLLMCSDDWPYFTSELAAATPHPNIFLDIKLSDTEHTVREAVKRFAGARIAAVSTCGLDATKVALEAADGRIKIWQWLWPSDKDPPARPDERPIRPAGVHGVIVPGYMAMGFWESMDVVVPGVRWEGVTGSDGHFRPITPRECRVAGATHAVVGRPIYLSADPVSAAAGFMEVLSGDPTS
jgi:orotidine-5'-phosphate decarboxylase